MKTIINILTLVLLSLGAIHSAYADGDRTDRARHKPISMKMMHKALNLTDEQVNKIRTIRAEAKTKRPSKRDMQQAFASLHQLDPNQADYPAQLDAAIATHTNKLATMMKKKAEVHQQVLAVLTPEQQSRLHELKQAKLDQFTKQ